jgi:hypothetical protein
LLKELLVEIDQADYVSKERLAVILGQSVSRIEDGLAELVRLGYLSQDNGLNCADLPCGKCPYVSMCHRDPLKTWEITDKGQRVLAR